MKTIAEKFVDPEEDEIQEIDPLKHNSFTIIDVELFRMRRREEVADIIKKCKKN